MTEKKRKFEADLNRLIEQGKRLLHAMMFECSPSMFKQVAKSSTAEPVDELVNNLPAFRSKYQQWYSEALALVKQVLPDRLQDFSSYYEYPHVRNEVTRRNYVIKDYLLHIRNTSEEELDAALPVFRQQLGIVEAAKVALGSRLIDLRRILQADLFDSELDGASYLVEAGHLRAAGVICGVVIEKHLSQVCKDRDVSLGKKPTINNCGDALKDAQIIDTVAWRRLQHLADVRNVCAHDKKREPTAEEVQDLIYGTSRVVETIF